MGKTIFFLKLLFIPCPENKYRPEIFSSHALFYYMVALLTLKVLILPLNLYFLNSDFFAEVSQVLVVNLTNQEREAIGMPALKENPELNVAAALKAQDILEKDYFEHQSPEGITPWHWFRQAGYSYKYAGENLAIGFLDSEEVVRAWLNSPSHRDNLLNNNYQEIGLAVAKGDFKGNEATVVVQLFGSPAKNTPALVVATEFNEEESAQAAPAVPKTPDPTSSSPVVLPSNIVSPAETSARLGFIVANYFNFIQAIIYGSLILVIVSLLLNIFIKFSVQYEDLILKALAFIFILLLFIFIDKGTLLNFIPHELMIR